MNDQHRQQLVEQYEDIALSLLMDDYAAEEGAKLLKEFEVAEKNGELPEFPDDLDENCRKLIDKSFAKHERNRLLTRIGKAALKVAVFAFVFMSLAVMTVMSVDALRVPVLNFVIQHTDVYTTLSTDEDRVETLGHLDEVKQRLAALVPPEYSLVVDNCESNHVRLYYQDADGHLIVFLVEPAEGTSHIDTEDATVMEIDLNGYDALFIEKDGFRVIWGDPEIQMIYDLAANGLDSQSFWELAYALAE